MPRAPLARNCVPDATTPAVRLPSVREVAAAQRQVDERLGGDDVAGDAALRLEQQPLGFDVDDLAESADLQRELQARHLPDAQGNGRALGAEPGERRLDDVVAG